MARLTIAEVAAKMYTTLHQITVEAEAGKPLSESLLAEAHKTLHEADRLRQLRSLVYADSHDDREQARPDHFAHARKEIEQAHDNLSEALEDPDAGNIDPVSEMEGRRAAQELMDGYRHQPEMYHGIHPNG